MREKYKRPNRINLRATTELDEGWVQNLIEDDPSILGLGDLVVKDRQRKQPRAGRLDLLLQDPETLRRYEVELQLGQTDETHIIRAIEYWDLEKKRYPHYEHCAVLVAEDITSRFLNVISLFNGTMPFIAIQMQAYEVGEKITLVFTRVMDEFSRGLIDDDEDELAVPADREYWVGRATKETVALADELLKKLHEFDPSLELNYNKPYIGLKREGRADNFVSFMPRKKNIIFELKLPQTDELNQKIDDAELDQMEYHKRGGRYRFRLTKDDIGSKSDFLLKLAKRAYELRTNS